MRREFLLAGAVAALAVLLGGDAAPVASGDIAVPASVQWAFSMGVDSGNLTPPLVQPDRIYIARHGALHCLDAVTGAEQWQFRPGRYEVGTGPVVAGDLIIVGATDSVLYGLNAKTGSTVWQLTCSAPPAPTPVIVNDLLMVGASQMVYAVTPSTGAVRWICSIDAPARYGPVSDGSMIYFVGQDGSVQCVDATVGRYRWGTALVKGAEFSPPVVASGRVIVASGKRVYGVARNGGVSYTAEMPVGVPAAPTVVDDRLFVSGVDGNVYVLVARSGAAAGRKAETPYKAGRALASSPCVTESLVIVGSADGLIFALDRTTGAVKWSYRCRAPDQLPDEAATHGVDGPLMVADGTLFAVTGSGDLYRFSASAPDAAGPVFGDFQPDAGSALPGGNYVEVTCSIVDDGSGVDPASIQATIDGSPVKMTFDVVTGVATSPAAPLPDGPHLVKVSAKDSRGNEASSEWSFVTDVNIITTGTPGQPGQPRAPGRPGARPAPGASGAPGARGGRNRGM